MTSQEGQNAQTGHVDETHREELEDLVARSDTGGRIPGPKVQTLLFSVALIWSLYQLFIASPLPSMLGVFLINDTQQRALHLTFALFLAFCAYPAFAHSRRDRIPITDWILAFGSAYCALHIVVFYEDVASRSGGIRTTFEAVMAVFGLLCVVEVARRALGTPLVIVSAVFVAYAFLGQYMPDIISHRGASFNRFIDHMWLTIEGVFGLPIGVSNSFIFLYVLFGSLLDKAGAGNFFIKLSFALLGHLRGGPAKAAVVSSGLTGIISGSAIANVVTTGTFTIPLMRRVGFSGERAAAIEVSSSINGQLMPPVMGAAAFLMSEFVGITYFEVIKHAFLPAIISYIALYYIVHLEAVKGNFRVLQALHQRTPLGRLIMFVLVSATIVILSMAIYFAVFLARLAFGDFSIWIIVAGAIAVYLGLVFAASRYPDLEEDDPSAPLDTLPAVKPTLMSGLYFLIPVGVLIWCLMIERLSPGRSVQLAIVTMFAVMLTQHPLLALFRGGGDVAAGFKRGFSEILNGMVGGARNMVGVVVAMASAGIIVGVVSLTGVGLLMVEVIDTISGGNILLMLFFTAVMSIILGMGLPTTANYIVVSSIMALPLVTLSAQSGLIVPLIAVHLFVFYFGLLSGTTPPVAVDAFAGAAVARSDPMMTSVNAFYYSMRTAILPLIFIFNPALLLIGVDSVGAFLLVFAASLGAMLLFAAATQGYFLVRSRWWETVALLVVAFTLIHPTFWLDRVAPRFNTIDPINLYQVVEAEPDGSNLRIVAEGENLSGDMTRRTALLPLGEAGLSGQDRLWEASGIRVEKTAENVAVTDLRFGGPAQEWGIDFGWEITKIQLPNQRMPKEVFFVPAIALLALVGLSQMARRRRAQSSEPDVT